MKIYSDSEKWKDPWFRKLSGPAKLLWFYLTDNADKAGVVDLDYELASEDCRLKIGPEHLAELGSRVQLFAGTKVLIGKFIKFQYGKLSDACVPHKRIFEAIERHGLIEGEDGVWIHPDGTQAERPAKPAKEAKPKPDSKARPESREEFDAYFREQGLLPRDAEYAWNHWESKGWRNGRDAIKDWKRTVITWKSGGYFPTQKNKLPEEQQWSNSTPSKPSWLPANWKEIAVSIMGDEALAFTDHTQIPTAHRYAFENACRSAA